MKFIPRLDVNFLDSTQIVDGRKVEPLYRTLLKAGAIKISQFDSFYIKRFTSQAIFCGCTAWIVSDVIGRPHDRRRDMGAYLILK